MVSALDYFVLGMSYIKRKAVFNADSERRFRSAFVTTPKIIFQIWNLIEPSLASETRYFHLLWALIFLKLYDNETVAAGIVGGVSEKTFGQHVWKVLVAAFENIKP